MFCKKCGKQLPDNVLFCTACGTPAVKPVTPVVPVVVEPAVMPEVEESVVAQIPEETPVLETFAVPAELPAVEEVPAAEELPAGEEVPSEEELPAVGEAPSEEELPAEEEVPSEEELPAEGEMPAEEALPAIEEMPEPMFPMDQPNPNADNPFRTVTEIPSSQQPSSQQPSSQWASQPAAPAVSAPAPTVTCVEVNEALPQKPVKARKKRPHIALRAIMQVLSFVLSLILVVTLMAGVLVMDLRKLTSSDNLENVIKTLLTGSDSEKEENEEAAFVPVAPSGPQVMLMADVNINVDEIPTDILTGGNSEENMEALVEWLYEEIKKNSTEKIYYSSEDLKDFVENSTVADYVSEKLAGFAEDCVNGTENTEITVDELMDLLEKNEKALEKELNITLTEKDKQKVNDTLVEVVEEKKLNETIREKVNTTMDEVVKDSLGMDLETVQGIIRQLTSDTLLYVIWGICLLLVVLLCVLNYYNVIAGLSWSSASGVMAGLLLSLPLLMLKYSADVIIDLLPEATGVVGLIQTMVAPIAPWHYWLLIGSLVLFVVTIVSRVIIWSVMRKRPVAV